MRDEEREADAQGREVGGAVLLGGEHHDGEDELDGEEHFDEEALGAGRAGVEGYVYGEGAGEEGALGEVGVSLLLYGKCGRGRVWRVRLG